MSQPTSVSPHIASFNREEFQAPGAASRIAPFWFWNCDMSEERVRHQVRQMAEAGCGGFFIHARQGLTLPYLSDDWFARVRLAVETAHECGLHAWLYDEYPYPSGIAGGLLTANRPELRARILHQSMLDATGEAPLRHEFELGRVVSALAYRVEESHVAWEEPIDVRNYFGVVLTREQFWHWPMGHIPYNEKRFMSDKGRLVLQWTPPAGEWRVHVGIEREQHGFKYFDCFFDPLHPAAAPEFLRLTHEPYRQHLSEYFGSSIPGIFTDEIEPPAWSPHIEAEIDLDLTQLLPALKHDNHPRAQEVRRRFRECALRLFAERWETPVAQWCAQNNLLWVAEKPTYRPMQFHNVAQPATDAGHRRADLPPERLTAELRANHRAAMAAAEQSGSEEVRCECFHSLGWGATLQDLKWSIDWLCAQGVNRFTPHAFYATSAGLTKHDAAPSFFAENPYWKHFHLLADYTARLGLAMSAGREVASIALLHPTASLWSGGEESSEVREEFEWLMNELMAQHHGFHPIDTLAFRNATAENGALKVGRARYRVLCVPPLSVVDDETAQAVGAALKAGVHVLIAEPLPTAQYSEKGMEMLALPGLKKIGARADWRGPLDVVRVLSVTNEQAQEFTDVWSLWRESGAQQILFLCNTSAEPITAHIQIAIACAWQQWSLEDGSISAYPAHVDGNRSEFVVALQSFGSMLLVGDAAPSARDESVSVDVPHALCLPTDGLWEITLDRPNALRLNHWRIACDGSDWSMPQRVDAHLSEIEALPLKYLDQVERRWVQACERREDRPIWYRRWISCEVVPEDLALLIENGAIAGDWSLWINGTRIEQQSFAPTEYHGQDKISCTVAPLFQCGANLVALCVENAPEMGGLRTPLHLIGSFGLGGEKQRTVVSLPRTSPFNDLVAAGLPHFSGEVTYRRVFHDWPSGFQTLELPPGFQDIAEVILDEQSLGVRAWSPYQWKLPALAGAQVEVQVAVTNTLLPFMEGQCWDAATHEPRNV
ncbi:MAG TPA: hypothetical protein VF600_04715 [Abditibacteriaceae bacterium]|jgi:hypothetical protein